MVKTTPAMKRLAATIGAAVQDCRASGMTAEEAFTVLAINCSLQAAQDVPAEHVEKMCSIITQSALVAA